MLVSMVWWAWSMDSHRAADLYHTLPDLCLHDYGRCVRDDMHTVYMNYVRV